MSSNNPRIHEIRSKSVAILSKDIHFIIHSNRLHRQVLYSRSTGGSNTTFAKDYLVASAIAEAASDYDSDYITRDEAVEAVAECIRSLEKESKEVRSEIGKVYRDDLGEREARATGETFEDVDLGLETDAYARKAAEKSNKGKSINFSGNVFGNYQTMEFHLNNLFDGGLTELANKAQNETITDDERVILDAVEDAKDRAMASGDVSAEVDGRTNLDSLGEGVRKDSEDAYRNREVQSSMETVEQISDARRASPSDIRSIRHNGLVSTSTGAFSASWDGYFASDADTSEYSTGISWDDLGSR